MLIRDGLPSLSTALLALVGFILFVIVDVLYNRYRALDSTYRGSGTSTAVEDTEATGVAASEVRAKVRRQWLQAGIDRIAQVRLRDHARLILGMAAVIALLFFMLRMQVSY